MKCIPRQRVWLGGSRSAAASLGVEVGQIVKSLVFLREDEPVLVLCAGDRRVDAERLGLVPARAERVRSRSRPSSSSRPSQRPMS